MTATKFVCAFAAAAALALATAACGSDSGSDSAATTTTHAAGTSGHTTHSGAAATVSSVVSSVADAARQGIQNAINAALAAAPISFADGSSDLSTVDNVTIKAVAVPLQGNDTRIRITTYATGSGDDAKALAEARANNIAAALEAEGIDKGRITISTEVNPSGDVQVDHAEIEVMAA